VSIRARLSLVGFASIIAAAAFGESPHTPDGEPWKPFAESGDVSVYTRPFARSGYPEVRASGTVCATLPELVDFVEDVARFDTWIPDTAEARLLARPTPRDQLYYIRTSMPWPVKHRDMIYRLTESTASRTAGAVSVTIEGEPDYLPVYPNIVRMTGVTGRWTFVEADRTTRIDLVMHIEPGGNVPQWLANRRIIGAPTKMIENLQHRFASLCHDARRPPAE
jgi:hypothetical protein